jgi:hypothetical protein
LRRTSHLTLCKWIKCMVFVYLIPMLITFSCILCDEAFHDDSDPPASYGADLAVLFVKVRFTFPHSCWHFPTEYWTHSLCQQPYAWTPCWLGPRLPSLVLAGLYQWDICGQWWWGRGLSSWLWDTGLSPVINWMMYCLSSTNQTVERESTVSNLCVFCCFLMPLS